MNHLILLKYDLFQKETVMTITQDTKNYRQCQLEKVIPEPTYAPSIKINGGNGNSTNFMNITEETLKKIADILVENE